MVRQQTKSQSSSSSLVPKAHMPRDFYFPSSTFCCCCCLFFRLTELLLLNLWIQFFFLFIAKTRHLSIRGFFFIVYQLCVCMCVVVHTFVRKKYKQRSQIYNKINTDQITKWIWSWCLNHPWTHFLKRTSLFWK